MTGPNRLNFLVADYQVLLDALQRDQRKPPQYDNVLSALLAQSGASSDPTRPVGGLGQFQGATTSSAPTAPRNFMADVLNALEPPRPPLAAAPTPQVRRRLFFSFHYADVRRTSIVRKSWKFRPGWCDPCANFTDKSLWEKSRSENREALRRLIRDGMKGTSVTCVLAGADTWSRPYVRYEIAHSLFRKNGLFTVFIHNVNDPHHGYGAAGRDPLSCIGLELGADGKNRVCELLGDQWVHYKEMTRPVPWPAWLPKPPVGQLMPLNVGAKAYDWHFDDGYTNLPGWAQTAAGEAGKR